MIHLSHTLATIPMPSPDPLGYPVPLPILQGLSYLTLTLHFVAMSFTLGAAALLLWVKLAKPQHANIIAKFLSQAVPLGFSYLVTLGIPPLLFVQVVYGQQFYSSSVIVGAHWILVVPLLILAYGLFYLHKFTPDRWPRGQWLFIAIAFLSMLTIAFFYVNNFTLAQTPDRWLELYAANPGGGTLNKGEPTLFARLLLFTAPASCGAALGLLFAGVFRARSSKPDAAAFKSLAWKSYALGLSLQFAGGFWLLATIPEQVRIAFLDGPGKWLAIGALVLSPLAGLALLWGCHLSNYLGAVMATLLWTLSLGCVVISRDLLRLQYLRPFFDPSTVQVNPQWTMFALFTATLLAGLALTVILTTVVVRNLTSPR